MNHLRRAHARAALSDYRSAAMAQAADQHVRKDWVDQQSAVAGW